MPLHDLGNEYVNGASLFGASNITVDTNGTGVDLQECHEDVTAVATFSSISAEEDATLTVEFEESADDSTYTDISGADMTQITASTTGNSLVKTFFNRTQRYVRAVANVGGTSPNITIHVALMGRKKSY